MKSSGFFASKTNIAFVSVIAALAALFVYTGAYSNVLSDSGAISAKVERLYELSNPGVGAEVVSVTSESGMYKVGVKITSIDGQVSYAESWVTKDGRLLTQSVILVEESVGQMGKLRDFVACLADSGVRIFGSLDENVSPQGSQATLLQLNLLGAYSPAIYVSCDADVQACVEAGITQVPAVYYNGTVEFGLKNIEQLEEISGCAF
jgi:hypothetical protein